MKQIIVVATVTFATLWMLFGFVVSAQGPPPVADWQFLDGPTAPGGYVTDLAISPTAPDQLFALTQDTAGYYQESNESFFYHSDDGAQTWRQTYTFTTRIVNLALDPNDLDVLLAGGDDALYRSNDRGITWTQVYTIGQAINVTRDGVIYTAGQIAPPSADCYPGVIGVAQSLNSGVTWHMVTDICARQVIKIVSAPEPYNAVYVAGWDRDDRSAYLLRSQDGGATWRDLLKDAPGNLFLLHPVYDFTIDPTQPSTLFLSDEYGLIRSLDGGETWERIRYSYFGSDSKPEAPPERSYALTFDSTGDLYAAPAWSYDTIHLYRSHDSGDTWWMALATLPQGVKRLIAHPEQSEELYAGLHGFGVYSSDTGGSYWRESNQGVRTLIDVEALATDPAHPNIIYAGAIHPRPGLYRSDDLGLSWTTVITDIPIQAIAVDPTRTHTGWAGGPKGLYSFREQEYWLWPDIPLSISSLAVASDAPEHRYFGGRAQSYASPQGGFIGYYVPRQDDALGYWRTQLFSDTFDIPAIAIDPQNPQIVYAGATGLLQDERQMIQRSGDGGQTWEIVMTERGMELQSLAIDPQPPHAVYGLSGWGQLFMSEDRGDTWALLNDEAYLHLAQDMALDGFGTPLAATAEGVYRWNKHAANWERYGLENIWTNALLHTGGEHPTLIAGTRTGIWRRNMPREQIWMPLMQRR